jgi:hypothetical protein
MKKVLQPAQSEDAVFYCDFSGELLHDNLIPCEITISFSYPSKRDGETLTLHLIDKEADTLMEFINSSLTKESKAEYIKKGGGVLDV